MWGTLPALALEEDGRGETVVAHEAPPHVAYCHDEQHGLHALQLDAYQPCVVLLHGAVGDARRHLGLRDALLAQPQHILRRGMPARSG